MLTVYSFIHIPKNAGTSIARFIRTHELPILISEHDYERKLGAEEIVVLRCPIDRFVSGFNYSKKYWPNPVNRHFSCASELAEAALSPVHIKHELALAEMGNRPDDILQRDQTAGPPNTVHGRVTRFTWVYEPQSSWLINSPKHILRYRYLDRDFNALLKLLRLDWVAQLPLLNTSERTKTEKLSPKSIEFVNRTYASDYAFIKTRNLSV